ncbi:MAG: hypothetical protein H7230_03825 [Candidatus Parcubacteria bacterium]|nr:hypothetical protein [Candidatus Paceibacterota bacterium]
MVILNNQYHYSSPASEFTGYLEFVLIDKRLEIYSPNAMPARFDILIFSKLCR